MQDIVLLFNIVHILHNNSSIVHTGVYKISQMKMQAHNLNSAKLERYGLCSPDENLKIRVEKISFTHWEAFVDFCR